MSRPCSRSRTVAPTTRSPSRRNPTTRDRLATCAPNAAAVRTSVIVCRASSTPASWYRTAPTRASLRRAGTSRSACRARELLVHRDAARPRRQAGHRVVQRETRCDVGPLPDAALERVHERDRVDEVRREPLQQQTPLAQRLPHQPEVEHLQVAQAAVDQLGRARRRAAGPVAGLDQRDAEPAGRGVEGRPGADDPAADDEDVDLLGRHRPQRRDPLGGAEPSGERPAGRLLRHARHHAGWYGDTTTSTRWSSLRSE